MSELVRLIRDALDRRMRAAGWRRDQSYCYQRRASPPFELNTQFWIAGEPVEVQAELSLTAPRVYMALVQLGEEDLDPTISRDPLAGEPPIESPEQVEAAAADIVRQIGAAAERMEAYATVDAFAAALESDPDTRDGAPILVPVILAVARRKREARERARRVPGDFAERLERWLAGERPPPPQGFEDTFSWREAFGKGRERRDASPSTPDERPLATWRHLARLAGTAARILRNDLPPPVLMPDQRRDWHPVQLHPGAQRILRAAGERSSLQLLHGAHIEARLEPGGPGRVRVLVDETEVGWAPAPADAAPADVPAKVERTRRDGRLELAVQLPGP